jgi:hypothetical protein
MQYETRADINTKRIKNYIRNQNSILISRKLNKNTKMEHKHQPETQVKESITDHLKTKYLLL